MPSFCIARPDLGLFTSCLAITRGGHIIDAHFDTKFNNTFDGRVQIPSAEDEKEFSLDTYIGYEPAAYKGLLLDKMREVSTTYKDFDKYKSILSLLEEVDPIDTELIGNDSLVREFLGGSIYTD